ncbi:MAG TPA: hypothetical protein VGP89_07590 [Candidatus Angelobacter sp.]|nr:hypothetical protein [Candidatus Angelobacter sp.]
MKISTRLKFVLPLLQFLFALGLWLYMPSQLETEVVRAMKLPPGTPGQHSAGLPPEVRALFYPPPAGRVLYAVNLPAILLSSQLASHLNGSTPAWEFTPLAQDAKSQPARYVVGIREIIFFAGVILIWLWVGSKIDEYILIRRGITIRRSRRLKATEMVVVVGMIAFLFVVCFICLQPANCSSSRTPDNELWVDLANLIIGLFYF